MSVAEIDTKCLCCICEASSSCNANVACRKSYFGGYRCGPLSILWHYWADAGAPKLEGDEHLPSEIAFENCVEEIYCAVQTVRNYITKFKNGTTADCNSDGKVDCEDYVQMHILGGYNCSQSKVDTDPRFSKFFNCLKSNKAS
ncbi:invertebrate-type lysozyme 2-like [Palaemon carinicauda]|uniref:invertebrate-type lysozyme 2-like n=1 Tax=Palaemon carinicauda TaxID=392227 RepID=UPI0035B68E85